MRVIVAGGRDFRFKGAVYAVLDDIHNGNSITAVVQGGANGVDALAAKWAADRGIEVETFVADWGIHGKSAGPIRNSRMVKAGADLLIAFPGGKGTADITKKAREAGIKVIEVE